MTRDRYNISYGRPLAVKDRPHRELDTSRGGFDATGRETCFGEDVALNEEPVLISELAATDAVEFIESNVAEVVPIGAD